MHVIRITGTIWTGQQVHKNTARHDVGNPGPGLIAGSPMAIHIKLNYKHLDRFTSTQTDHVLSQQMKDNIYTDRTIIVICTCS